MCFVCICSFEASNIFINKELSKRNEAMTGNVVAIFGVSLGVFLAVGKLPITD